MKNNMMEKIHIYQSFNSMNTPTRHKNNDVDPILGLKAARIALLFLSVSVTMPPFSRYAIVYLIGPTIVAYYITTNTRCKCCFHALC